MTTKKALTTDEQAEVRRILGLSTQIRREEEIAATQAAIKASSLRAYEAREALKSVRSEEDRTTITEVIVQLDQRITSRFNIVWAVAKAPATAAPAATPQSAVVVGRITLPPEAVRKFHAPMPREEEQDGPKGRLPQRRRGRGEDGGRDDHRVRVTKDGSRGATGVGRGLSRCAARDAAKVALTVAATSN